MGAYKITNRILGNSFKNKDVVFHSSDKNCGILIYNLGNDKVLITVSGKHGSLLFNSISVDMEEFINDRDKVRSDLRLSNKVKNEFNEFCDKYYNLIRNMYGRDC